MFIVRWSAATGVGYYVIMSASAVSLSTHKTSQLWEPLPTGWGYASRPACGGGSSRQAVGGGVVLGCWLINRHRQCPTGRWSVDSIALAWWHHRCWVTMTQCNITVSVNPVVLYSWLCSPGTMLSIAVCIYYIYHQTIQKTKNRGFTFKTDGNWTDL